MLKIYHVPVVTCVLNTPLVSDDGKERLTHYTRSYYVAAVNEADALEVLRGDTILDGATMVDAEQPVEASVADIPRRGMLSRLRMPRKPEVCWKSGRVFFPPE